MLHVWAANIRCDRYCSNFLDFGVQLNKVLFCQCYTVKKNHFPINIFLLVDTERGSPLALTVYNFTVSTIATGKLKTLTLTVHRQTFLKFSYRFILDGYSLTVHCQGN